MTYYIRDTLPEGSVLGQRRPTINEFFLSSYTLSIYAGCEFGCPYCDGWAYGSRPLNEVVRVPFDLPQRLDQELATIDRRDLIGVTALSDPYQPAEQQYRITRQVLQLFADVGQPCLILTKSANVLDDLPLLRRINERALAIVMTTLVTMDPRLSALLENKSPLPGVRLEMLAAFKRAGIPVGVAILPILPYINDTDVALNHLLRACAEVGVDFVVWDYLHIPNSRHRMRISELTPRINSYPASYYRDIYAERPFVSTLYRTECDARIITRCDDLGLEMHVPHSIFAGRLRPSNEAALVLKHAARRDILQGRINVARQHSELADLIYRGQATQEQLRASSLWDDLWAILETK